MVGHVQATLSSRLSLREPYYLTNKLFLTERQATVNRLLFLTTYWLRMSNEIQCILPYVIRSQCNTVHSKTLQLHKRNNRLSHRMTYLLIILLAPSPIPSQIPHTVFDIIIHSVWMQFYVMTRTHVRQFITRVHVATCHSTVSWIMSNYFPMTGFKATVRASTGDNRHNCATTRWGMFNRWADSWLNDVMLYIKWFFHPEYLRDVLIRSDGKRFVGLTLIQRIVPERATPLAAFC